MRSTFHGLEVAKRGMFTQQTAISVTGHNISNANTPGYTRQRVNFQSTQPYPSPGMNRPQIPGQMGTGVEAGSIQRVRESFLDDQFRGENNKLGYWQTKSSAVSKMEDILNEPSKNGLSAVMGQFWQSLQDLSTNPENEGARSVVLQRAKAIADTFHYLHNSISAIQNDLGNQISVTVKEVNSILKQISSINQQISEIEPHGYLPNDLYDARDQLVDQLSQYMNIKVEKVETGGNAQKIAEGTYKISLVNADGSEVPLIDGDQFNQIGVEGGTDSDKDGILDQPAGALTNFKIVTPGTPPTDVASVGIGSFSQGKLKALGESYGYTEGGVTKGLYPEMLANLDKLAKDFVEAFNDQHKLGKDFDGKDGVDFFTGTDAATISVAITETSKIAASANGDKGNGSNALKLADVQMSTVVKPYEGIIGALGVEGSEARRMTKNSAILAQSVETNRQSISSVSLDEEMTDLIRFQHAYNAAARNITVVDEMLDKIINGMGTVGR